MLCTTADDALATGCMAGSVGNIDLTPVNTLALANVLENAQEWKPSNPDTRRLIKCVASIHELRVALSQRSWDEIASLLATTSTADMPIMSREEVAFIQDEMRNRDFLIAAYGALTTGGPTGGIDSLACDMLQLDALDSGAAMVETHGVKSELAAHLANLRVGREDLEARALRRGVRLQPLRRMLRGCAGSVRGPAVMLASLRRT